MPRNPEWQERYRSSVFINCPFDDDYVPILHAITFAIRFARFLPRSALEANDSGEERLSRIVGIVRDCRFGVHDISRVELSKLDPDALPRYNMPFELGLYYGAVQFGDRSQKSKKMLILDGVEHRADKTLSDIGGKDPMIHGNDPAKAIACVRRFLSDKVDGRVLPGEEVVQGRYAAFQGALPTLLHEFGLNSHEIRRLDYWRDYVHIVNEYLKRELPGATPAGG